MSDDFSVSTWRSVAQYVCLIAIAIGGWIMRLYAKKIDDLEKSHQNLVSREYLDEQLDRMREDRLQMHRENRESIDNLVERMDRILERVR